ncbi:PREDICTED: probable G-protein coupled receptor 157 [Amphimedon queenslandica]|uniref:G-protein coupled receptors family 2 profile 2 domain-containing protein n=1 Tax=Amphimedon queenslandica TaxID=400682 RepID=A0A1X7UQN1_AMPQE|nr:PREDICTED: probable G-protein coupled receptor 157 [Amphimedon queenslandica]|eukprot:XP_011404342.1 PREDICTED: probable G-protein coupled receptor 157 [Amphimedon queenslandica]
MVGNTSTFPTVANVTVMAPFTPDKALRSVLGVTCCLSILGSLAVILTYFCFKSLRTTPRLVLVHLSFMDMGVGLANLVGLCVNFDSYYFPHPSSPDSYEFGLPKLNNVSGVIHYSCIVQGFAAIYFTLGSFLWTISMAVYLYLRIVHNQLPGAARRALFLCTIISYTLPIGVVMWEGLTRRLGYSPFSSEGWCGNQLIDLSTGKRQVLMDFFGYQVWVLIIFIIVPVLYVSALSFICQELKKTRSQFGIARDLYKKALHKIDYKLLLIPVAFLLLRIWSQIDVAIYVYIKTSLPTFWHGLFTYLSGIGDSGQGFVNAILFVVLTKKVRAKLFPCCKRLRKEEDETSSIKKPLEGNSAKYGLQYKSTSRLNSFSPMS